MARAHTVTCLMVLGVVTFTLQGCGEEEEGAFPGTDEEKMTAYAADMTELMNGTYADVDVTTMKTDGICPEFVAAAKTSKEDIIDKTFEKGMELPNAFTECAAAGPTFKEFSKQFALLLGDETMYFIEKDPLFKKVVEEVEKTKETPGSFDARLIVINNKLQKAFEGPMVSMLTTACSYMTREEKTVEEVEGIEHELALILKVVVLNFCPAPPEAVKKAEAIGAPAKEKAEEAEEAVKEAVEAQLAAERAAEKAGNEAAAEVTVESTQGAIVAKASEATAEEATKAAETAAETAAEAAVEGAAEAVDQTAVDAKETTVAEAKAEAVEEKKTPVINAVNEPGATTETTEAVAKVAAENSAEPAVEAAESAASSAETAATAAEKAETAETPTETATAQETAKTAEAAQETAEVATETAATAEADTKEEAKAAVEATDRRLVDDVLV